MDDDEPHVDDDSGQEEEAETDGEEGEQHEYVLGSRPYMFEPLWTRAMHIEPRALPRPLAAQNDGGEAAAAAAGAVEDSPPPSPSTASSAESDSDEQEEEEDAETDGEEGEHHEYVLGARPYMFEPLALPPADNHGGGDEAAAAAPLHPRPSWCTCGHCQDMDDPKQRLCCKDVDQVMEICAEAETEPTCITLHPGFGVSPWVQQALLAGDMVQHCSHFNHNLPDEERYRQTAYRSFMTWCWGYAGRNVVIPSCAVNKIRSAYTGIRLPPLEMP